VCLQTERQTDIDTETDKQTDRQNDKQKRLTDRQTKPKRKISKKVFVIKDIIWHKSRVSHSKMFYFCFTESKKQKYFLSTLNSGKLDVLELSEVSN
jgi:hypothetical protein